MEPILKVINLSVNYNIKKRQLPALRDINFTAYPGQIVGIVGESGCGKSTLASSVMQLLPSNGKIVSGKLLFRGHDLRKLNGEGMRRLRGRELSMIFQDPMSSLNPVYTIGQQMVDAILSHPRAERPLGRGEAVDHAVQMLRRVGIPDAEQRINDYPHQFSGGMRQRIMIATALQSNPALLIADEPTSALDVTLEAQIIELIRALRDEKQTGILYITHNLGVVAQLCDYVLVLYAGNIVESGDVQQIFKNPLHPYTHALLHSHPMWHAQADRLTTIRGRVPSLANLPEGCKFAKRCTLAEEICSQAEPKEFVVGTQRVFCHIYDANWKGSTIAPIQKGAPGSAAFLPKVVEKKKEVLCLQQLETRFYDPVIPFAPIFRQRAGVVKAVNKIDLDVKQGETIALVGESGSGKTTLGRTILRLERLSGGAIIFKGQRISDLSQSQIRPMRVRMQMIFQDPFSSLSPRKTVSQLLLEPFHIHRVDVNKARKIDELLEMVGLSAEQADKYPHQLSGGQARRVGIARALALQPDLLIADEPTAGLDVSVAAEILNLLKDLREKLDLTYIIITHNLESIGFIANRVAVMYLGKIVELGGTDRLLTNPGHPYTKALMSSVVYPDPEMREQRRQVILEGEIPSPRNPPSGCSFHPRCNYRQDMCLTSSPRWRHVTENEGSHFVACHFPLGN